MKMIIQQDDGTWLDPQSGRRYTGKEVKNLQEDAAARQQPPEGPVSREAQGSPAPNIVDPEQVKDFSGALGFMGKQALEGGKASLGESILGAKQLGTYIFGGKQDREAVNQEIADLRDRYQAALSTPAGKVGHFVGDLAQFVIPGAAASAIGKAIPATSAIAARLAGAPGSIRRAATTAAAFEGIKPIDSMNTNVDDYAASKLARMALGAGAGAAVGAIANRITRPSPEPQPGMSGIDQEARAVGFTGDKALTPAQATQNRDLLQLEEGLLSSQGSSGLIAGRRANQHRHLNETASAAMGYPGRPPTEAVFGAARDNANLAYKPIANIQKLNTDVPYFDDLMKIAKETKSKEVSSVVRQIQKNGSLPGEAFLEHLQDVRTLAADAGRAGQQYQAQQFSKLGNAMEDFLERILEKEAKKPGNFITSDTLDQFRSARTDLSVIHALEKSTDPVRGTVDPNKVLKEQFRRQRPGSTPSPTAQKMEEVLDIARVMRKTMPYIGSSGTAERLGGQATVEAMKSPEGAARFAVNSMANRFLGNRYLKHGGEPGFLGDRLPPWQNAMIRRMLPQAAVSAGEALTE